METTSINRQNRVVFAFLFGFVAGAAMAQSDLPETEVSEVDPPTGATLPEASPQPDADDSEPLITADEDVEDRMTAYASFVTAMEEDDWEEATDWAELVVDLTEDEYGPDHEEMITPLNNMAVAQMRSGRYKLAETTFVRSLNIIDTQLGIFHPRLVNPLVGLGTLLNTLGRHDDAMESFRRAQHVQHRETGVMGMDQIATVNAISQTHMLKGEYLEARNARLFGLRIERHTHGPESAEYSDALSRLGRWYLRSGMFSLARLAYVDAITVMEAAKGPNDRALIKPLRGLANAIRRELGARKKPGTAALERIVQIEAQSPEATPQDVIQAELDLADWTMQHGKPRDAVARYQRIWNLLQEADGVDDDLQSAFDRPVRLTRMPYVPTDAMSPLEDGGTHFARYQFTVTEEGRTADVEVVDSTLSPAARNMAKRTMRGARYRPRLVEGVPVATANVQVRQEF